MDVLEGRFRARGSLAKRDRRPESDDKEEKGLPR